MDPVRGVVELPVGVAVTLLQRVPGAHAQLNGDDVGLDVRKVVACTGKAHRLAIDCEELAGHVMVTPHGSKGRSVSGCNCPELHMTVRAWVGHRGDDHIM